MVNTILVAVPLLGVLALIFMFIKRAGVSKLDPGNELMQRIGKNIYDGAMAFLKAEYKVLAIFVAVVAVILAVTADPGTSSIMIAVAFVLGAICSALAGFIGMDVATKANIRTTQAARTSLGKALGVAFDGGSVMGLGVVGLGLLGLGSLFLLFKGQFAGDILITDATTAEAAQTAMLRVITVITGFSFGASSIALFARVGGGIYTKAADVGADLVGKVEAGIPEDHPLNPATIADNVGDNVGDVAGMGADLFESYVGSIIGTMVIGAAFMVMPAFYETDLNGLNGVLLPLVVAGIGIIASIIGTFFVRVKEGGDPQKALNTGELIAAVIMLIGTFFAVTTLMPDTWSAVNSNGDLTTYTDMGVFYAILLGLVAGLGIGYITEFYTGTGTKPVQGIVDQSLTGAATNLIAGLAVGMRSTAYPILVLCTAIIGSYYFAGLYGIGIAAVGMLANTGIQLAIDAYGPICDNAGGIAEMAGLPKEVRERTDKLDAVGNTTAAIGKGFAIGSAALTALVLFAAFMQTARITSIDVANPFVMAGLFLGAMLPFLFSAFSMEAVGRAANDMIQEVRRQFNEIPELKAALAMMKRAGHDTTKYSPADLAIFNAADGKADYEKCVEISTQASIREMVMPGLIAVLAPVVVGFAPQLFGAEPAMGAQMLGGLLAGVTSAGVMMAIFQSNAGGAWDNAKKMFEEGASVQGTIYHKGSEPHKAAVVGDTVGDPFKDTSGPSLNILLKLMAVVSLVIAPFLV
ncbi:sodium-translocating pyrophosphatase [Neolewinella antarctica]|uniref:Putative K(+)-stimulated pyrophosphate-energized sodium pump n=1 Tax=Neolewinella antarctica TaxID=442734 RepID=A0ABX0XEZ5_9BACT|nr:sodium-translocating pyrophosphatase [Neolewinella antarctica]NJC27893.1 K(+)-stimulated pyrophosphate-energized sodium pump [Neolewinella antarctica]